MCDSTGNIYFSSGRPRIPHSRPSTSNDQNIIPHLLAPLPYEAPSQPYLGTGENAQNISVQFTGRDTTQLDSDILQRRLSFDHGNPTMAAPPVAYPESSQRTTSYALSPYATDPPRFNDLSSCNLVEIHAADMPLHGMHTSRRCSWPSPSQMAYSTWMQSTPRTARSTASEPPESTSDDSYQDSESDEMSLMMNQFQIQSSRNVNLPQQHMHHAQTLQPSIMTFQLSETMLQPVDDPENPQTLRRPLDMNIVVDDESEVRHPHHSSTFPSSSSTPFRGVMWQGLGMRLQHDGERPNRSSQYYVPVVPSNSLPFPTPHISANARVGDQRMSGAKQPKKSKMHQCKHCNKMFPRPSGLATHMNSHLGAKPYKCIVPTCDKRFAVRSNAKRHLRTHGINPSSPDALSIPPFTIGFEEPMVTQVHDAGRQPSRYRWITQNPSPHESGWGRQGSSSPAVDAGSRDGLAFQTSMSSGTSSTLSNVSDDDCQRAASLSATDVQQYQSDYNRDIDEFPGSYPSYG